MTSDSKRIKLDAAPYLAIDACSKQIIELKQTFNQRMTTMENRMASVTSCCNTVAMRLDSLETLIKSSIAPPGGACNTIHRHPCCDEVLRLLKGLRQEMSTLGCGDGSSVENQLGVAAPPVVIVHQPSLPTATTVQANVGLDSKMQVITLNSEADYPDGSWLGDDSNPECRVRVPISPLDLLHINSFCHSPEKMALMLLDYLFPREVLAVSNLSGKGKHGKKQLSPLMIYGIRCHLVHRFSIVERDWYRIKQNMDSKCRTAWRKKLKGLPLGGFKHMDGDEDEEDDHQHHNPTLHSVIVTSTRHMGSDDSVDELDPETVQLIQTSQGGIKVMHATPAQLARMQEAHNIQVINEDELLPAVLQESSGMLTSDGTGELVDGDTLSLGEHQTLTLVTSTGEVLSLSAAGGLSLGDEGTSSLGDDDSKLLSGCTD